MNTSSVEVPKRIEVCVIGMGQGLFVSGMIGTMPWMPPFHVVFIFSLGMFLTISSIILLPFAIRNTRLDGESQ